MKVQRRTVPLDVLSVSKGKRKIILSTHRHSISLATYSNGIHQQGWQEFTFDQLYNFINNLRDGITEMHNEP